MREVRSINSTGCQLSCHDDTHKSFSERFANFGPVRLFGPHSAMKRSSDDAHLCQFIHNDTNSSRVVHKHKNLLRSGFRIQYPSQCFQLQTSVGNSYETVDGCSTHAGRCRFLAALILAIGRGDKFVSFINLRMGKSQAKPVAQGTAEKDLPPSFE